MTHAVGSLELDRLTVGERLDLIAAIWDSIPESVAEHPLPESHRRELERRLEAADADPGRGIPWEDVLAQLKVRP